MSEGIFNGKATAVFQYMPPGRSVICATVDGKRARREVFVDASTAERLQRDLVEKLAAADAGQKAAPCGLFDHRDGAACLHPKRFTWDDERGVLLEAEWTQAGKAAVEGRDYLYWSPTFRRHKESGRVVGLQAGVEVGSLVNNPAFESIEPVAAAAADDGGALDGECEDVNCCGRETVDAAHCNQYEHVPGCEHENGGVDDGKRDYAVGAAKKKLISATKEHQKALDEYNAAMNGGEADKEKITGLEKALVDTYSKYSRARVALINAYKKYSKSFDADMDELEKLGKLNFHSDNVKSSNQKDTMKEHKETNDGGEEVFASKRVCDALLDALEAVSAAHKCCDELEEPEDEEEAAKRHKAHLERLKAALEAEEDDEKKAVLKKRIEELESANPYGCNQYGHSFKSYHRGFSSNANIAKKKQDKKNAVAKLNELARKRKK